MKNLSPAVSAYIAKSPEYARPILKKIRELFHKGCPALEEKIKWGAPSFEYKGMMGGMAAFKKYATIVFWKAKLMSDAHKLLDDSRASIYRLTFAKLADMPSDTVLVEYIREAAALNEGGAKIPRAPKKSKSPLIIPDYFESALKKNKKARVNFEALSPSHQREYVEWLTEAKQEETRARRLATALEWLEEGKPRNWKYMKK